MPVDLDEPVELASYDAEWPGRAEREIERLRPVLPGDAAVVHIGSTAILAELLEHARRRATRP